MRHAVQVFLKAPGQSPFLRCPDPRNAHTTPAVDLCVVSLSRCPVFIARDLSGFAFSSLLSFSLPVSRRRRCGNVEIRRFGCWPDFQARGKEWESPPFDFSTLSTARHFHSVARAVFSPLPATGLPPCSVRPRGDR